MEKVPFLGSVPGRIASFATALGLFGAGALAIMDGPYALHIATMVTLVVAVAFIVAVGLSLAPYPLAALGLVLFMPFVAGLYFVGTKVLIGSGTSVGAGLLAAGVLPILLTFIGGRRAST